MLALRRQRPLLADFTDTQLHDIVHGLWRKGWLDRIEPGKYVVVPRAARRGWSEHPFVVAEGIAPPEHYVSYWSALSHHDLTEQLPRVVYVATLGVKKPELRYRGWRYRFVPLTEPKFFGFTTEEFTALNGAAHVEVQVAEPEKAIIDSLDHERFSDGIAEAAKAVRRGLEGQRMSVPRLLEYAVRFPNAAVAARLGHLLERYGAPAEATEPLRAAIRRRGPPPYLSPRAPREGAALDPRWYLRVNVSGGARHSRHPWRAARCRRRGVTPDRP